MTQRTTIAVGRFINGEVIITKPNERIITSNSVEMIKIRYDGERFALIQDTGEPYNFMRHPERVIILNPREAQSIAEFILKITGRRPRRNGG